MPSPRVSEERTVESSRRVSGERGMTRTLASYPFTESIMAAEAGRASMPAHSPGPPQ